MRNGCARCAIPIHRYSITGRSSARRLDNGSGVNREIHAPFCERLKVKLLGSTHHFGMKLHIGVDSQSGLAHSAMVTAANVHDKHPLPHLLHGREKRVYGDSAYASQKALMHDKTPQAKDFTSERVRKRKDGEVDEAKRAKNRNKSKIRARVEPCLPWSSGCGASRRCAIAAWPRMHAAPSRHWPWRIFTWRAIA